MLKKIVISTVAIFALGQTLLADDYHLYGEWNIDNLYQFNDVTGYIDTAKKLNDNANAEYVIFNSGGIGYIYQVQVNGDPNMHPDNPLATGSIAERTFTFVSKSPFSLPSWGGSDEFYVDETGIYFGSGYNIKHWDFNWSNETDIITNGNIWSETLAYNQTTHEWWTTTRDRDVYRYQNNQWKYQFTYPSLEGSHHDGMEIVENILYLSDMTSDKIIAYQLDEVTGDANLTPRGIYSYTASPVVEGMGYGPNNHFWIGGNNEIYEIGEGNLTTTCSQTFNYTTNWSMQRSKCDNIKVPGFDDTIMAKMENGKLIYATADAGAKAWLKRLDCNVTVVDELTLNTGDGVWLVGKTNITKNIAQGESRNNYMYFLNGAYSFIGFDVEVDLNSKFGTAPVENIYYYANGHWNSWSPVDGSKNVPANQGLYVLPNADFNLLIK